MTAIPRHVALLRGINLGSHKRIPMPELRALCTGLGWLDVRTYIQSGNVVFRPADATRPPAVAALEAQLEDGIARRFGFDVPVIVRDGGRWRDYVANNPFPDATATEPNRVMLLVSKAAPLASAAEDVQQRARDGERVRLTGDALWIHYPSGQGTSRLSPAVIDRCIGSPATSRNWRSVLALAELMG